MARERTGAVGRRRETRPLHTQSLQGSMQEGKERAREGRHLPPCMVVTADTSQRPMSWSNETAEWNTAQVPHAPQATQNTPHQQEERGTVRVQKGLRTDSQGKVSKAIEDQRRAARERTAAVGCRRGTRPLHAQSLRGSMKEGKERAREGRNLLRSMVVTADTSQLSMSWLNAFA